MIRALLLWLALALPSSVYAGRPCEVVTPTGETVAKALNLAKQTFDTLEQSGTQLALIARVGQDLSKYNLRYSHYGFAVRDHADGRWTVVHLLNKCGTASSNLYNEGLGNFFLDDMFAYEALIVVPRPGTQERLLAVLRSELPLALHSKSYNMLAYPFSTQYQNSNQWALELMAAAYAKDVEISDRAQAQAWLKMMRYEPTKLTLRPLTRLGGRMFKANIAFDDHPGDKRWSDRIETVTVESVFRFLERLEPEAQPVLVKLR